MTKKLKIAGNIDTVYIYTHTDSLKNNKKINIEKKIGILCLYQNVI